MEQKQINQIKKLQSLLEQWNYEYYVLGKPSVSDSEYDRVFDELKGLDPDSIKIGSDIPAQNSPLVEYPHPVKMLSLDKVYTIEELQKWMQKITSEFSFSVEPKIDGVSVSLEYQKGKLLRALTRGDGLKGSDITHNILTIAQVPRFISILDTVYIRGEVYITKQDFKDFKASENIDYANPRNLTAGVLRRLDPNEVKKVPLQIFLYQAQKEPINFSTQQEALAFLFKEGFPLPPYLALIDNIKEIAPYIHHIKQERGNIPFDIDGLVIKVNKIQTQNSLGETAHHPRWAMAFKFDSPTAVTTVENITIQVGRTGKITPLAYLKPVEVQGSTVQKATLHNKEYIDNLGLGIGDIVSISKRGDIIPAIEEVLEKMGENWLFPTHCPSCYSELILQGAHFFCINTDCPERVKMNLFYFAQQLEMDGFGEAIINLLYDEMNIKFPQDLWSIEWDKLKSKEGFGEKKIQNLQTTLNNTPTNTSFKKILIALGIPDISDNALQIILSQGYTTLQDFQSLTLEILLNFKGIGNKTAQRIIESFQPDSTIVHHLYALEKIGFVLQESIPKKNKQDLYLNNTYWVLTGIFNHYKPRDKASEIIAQLGGSIQNNITKQTTHLLYGEEAGSKMDKAKTYPNIRLISEQEFMTEVDNQKILQEVKFKEDLF